MAGLGLAAGAGAGAARAQEIGEDDPQNTAAAAPPPAQAAPPLRLADWARVRAMFQLAPDWIDMSAMLLTSHPKPVRDAIERHRRELDVNTIPYLERNNRPLQQRARDAIGRYMGVSGADVALTGSTTEGVALVYNGLRLRYGDEILTTNQGYYVTHEAIRLKAAASGARVRKINLYDRIEAITADQIVNRLMREIGPQTRVLALTWVHSSTGLKIPVPQISKAVAALNATRPADKQVLVCLDAVHGFGNQDIDFNDLGCDVMMAACHKWLFGPRGTGVIIGKKNFWDASQPTVPTFIDRAAYGHWISGADPGPNNATRMSPGGFKPFEHLWALGDATVLHDSVGRANVAARTAELAGRLKQGLAAMPHVTLATPLSPDLSAGIVAFDVKGMNARAVVNRLREWKVIASVAPYAHPWVRLTPSVRNFPEEIDFALQAIGKMG